MKIQVEIKDGGSSHSPVYNEPYDGFFKEKGFRKKDHSELCDGCDSYSKRIHIFAGLEKSLSSEPGIVLMRDIYYNVGKKMHIDFGNSAHGNFSDGAKKVKCILVEKLEEMEKKGIDTKNEIISTINSMKQYGGNFWTGYISIISTTSATQVLVLDEDFGSAKQKSEEFINFAKDSASKIYSKLSHPKLVELDSKHEEINNIFMKTNYDISMKLMCAKDIGSLKEFGNTKEEIAKNMEKEINDSSDRWVSDFNNAYEKSGVTKTEQELHKLIGNFAKSKSLNIHERIFDDESKKKAISEAFEDIMR